eukprot:m51a1_g4623 hypothetical protein (1673) ;mRNA; f:305189-312013
MRSRMTIVLCLLVVPFLCLASTEPQSEGKSLTFTAEGPIAIDLSLLVRGNVTIVHAGPEVDPNSVVVTFTGDFEEGFNFGAIDSWATLADGKLLVNVHIAVGSSVVITNVDSKTLDGTTDTRVTTTNPFRPEPSAPVACCIPVASDPTAASDPSGPTSSCRDGLKASECQAVGGTPFQWATCLGLSLDQCPFGQVQALGACCTPLASIVNESGVFPRDCIADVTKSKCTLMQGVWHAGSQCLQASGERLCPAVGACCRGADTAVNITCANNIVQDKCTPPYTFFTGVSPHVLSESASSLVPVDCIDRLSAPRCKLLQGQWLAGKTCAEVEERCPVRGACCRRDGCFNNITQGRCDGQFFTGKVCAGLTSAQCPIVEKLGSCCLTGSLATLSPRPRCVEPATDGLTDTSCDLLSGRLFAWKNCSALTHNECPVPEPAGACCSPRSIFTDQTGNNQINCVDRLAERQCAAYKGVWHKGQTCAELNETCPEVGACCTEGQCIDRSTSTKCSGHFFPRLLCSSISANMCPSITQYAGACCLTSLGAHSPTTGRCALVPSEAYCKELSGAFYANSTCGDLSDDQCPETPITGACCVHRVDSSASVHSATCRDGITKYLSSCDDNVSQDLCRSSQGAFYADATCSGLPSDVCPVPEPLGACCNPKMAQTNQSGTYPVSCIDKLTSRRCRALQGQWFADLSCQDIKEKCAPNGACCSKERGCQDSVPKDSCNGKFFAAMYCNSLSPNQCPWVISDKRGACCVANYSQNGTLVFSSCILSTTEDKCKHLGGQFFVGTTCSALTEKQDEATSSACKELGGQFFQGTRCSFLSPNQCPVPSPTGACCNPRMSVVTGAGMLPMGCADGLVEDRCKNLQGSWNMGRRCADLNDTCLKLGACITSDSCRNQVPQSQCSGHLGGTHFLGTGCGSLSGEQCPDVMTRMFGSCCVFTSNVDTASCYDNMTAMSCKDLSGVFSLFGICSQLSRSQCPVPERLGACCSPKLTIVNGSGTFPIDCIDAVTQDKCKNLEGTWFDSKTCNEVRKLDLCPRVGACCRNGQCVSPVVQAECRDMKFFPECPSEPTGSCCAVMEGGHKCLSSQTLKQCNQYAGKWYQGRNCSDMYLHVCPVQGSCCMHGSTGVDCADEITLESCQHMQGNWYAHLTCTTLGNACPVLGACCTNQPGSGCIDDVTSVSCTGNKTFFPGHSCESLISTQRCTAALPTGACCLHSAVLDSSPHTCLDNVANARCSLMGGTFFQNQKCSGLGDKCPLLGSCCGETPNSKGCTDGVLPAKCDRVRGAWSKLPCSNRSECPRLKFGACCGPSQLTPSAASSCLDNLVERKCSALDLGERCEALGACCIGPERCVSLVSRAKCKLLDGTFSPGQRCTDRTCVARKGSCCNVTIRSVIDGRYTISHCTESWSALECTAKKGSWTTGGTCDTVCPERPVVYGTCCIEGKCTDASTYTLCKERRGVWAANKSCSQVTAEECPGNPDAATGSCCLPSRLDCLNNQVDDKLCTTLEGTWMPGVFCNDTKACPPLGSCCSLKNGASRCDNSMSMDECAQLQGQWRSGQWCSASSCFTEDPKVGVCCHPRTEWQPTLGEVSLAPRCLEKFDQLRCSMANGTFFASIQDCGQLDAKQCPEIGACCYWDPDQHKVCSDNMPSDACRELGGTLSPDTLCPASC